MLTRRRVGAKAHGQNVTAIMHLCDRCEPKVLSGHVDVTCGVAEPKGPQILNG